MSYELEHVTHISPCPCGKSHVVRGWGTNDWGQVRENMYEIWCSECYKNYRIESHDLLVPKDYPRYQGDVQVKNTMDILRDKIDNFAKHPSRSVKERRRQQCCDILTRNNIMWDLQNMNIIDNRIKFITTLVMHYTSEELQDAFNEMNDVTNAQNLYLPQSRDIRRWHKSSYRTIAIQELRRCVQRAILLYDYIKQYQMEDESQRTILRQEYERLQAEYHKDLPQYLQERAKYEFHLKWSEK